MINTAIVYDPVFIKHDRPGHPESARRLEAIMKKITDSGLIKNIIQLNPQSATVEEVKLCHTEDYIERVKDICNKGGGFLDPDTYTTKYSYDAAMTAVGSLIELSDSVINGQSKNGFALLRPPGHHALKDRAMGFCVFGNVAIAVKVALQNNEINKVAIVDIDVHHGNGTQALVEDNSNILYISTHQYPFYPGTGGLTEIGKGNYEGTLMNIPLPPYVGDNGFIKIYSEAILPKIEKFHPDILFVSAGYDAHWDDPLSNMGLTLTGYSWISEELVKISDKLCDSKIVFTLEGGYNLESLSFGVVN
jgi:acetoin utilization deacetylase AcuC-like enzyme